MTTFKDARGRDWLVTITVAAVKRCRATPGVDLYALVDDGFQGLGELLADPVRFVDVLCVLSRDAKGDPPQSDEDFGESMAGDAIGRATDAFLAELTDFFPDPRVRAGLKAVLAKGREVTGHLLTHLEAEIGGLDADSVAKTLIASYGNSPGSSGSTPALLPFENSP